MARKSARLSSSQAETDAASPSQSRRLDGSASPTGVPAVSYDDSVTYVDSSASLLAAMEAYYVAALQAGCHEPPDCMRAKAARTSASHSQRE
jgi:hypothetical protein